MKPTRGILTILFVCAYLSFANCCHTFKNTEAEIKPQNEQVYTDKITGCIERANDAFQGKTIEHVAVKQQMLPHIFRDSIRHLVKLKSIRFEKCEIESIHPYTFRNLPRVVEIAFTGNNISEIKAETFARDMPVQILNLNDNNIKSVENFQNMPKLKRLLIKNNKISAITNNWFINSTSLQEIDISHNKLENLTANCFQYTKNLVKIDLSYNDISKLSKNTFDILKNIDFLNLRNNRISQIDGNAFVNNAVINHLNLGANKLNYLPTALMDNIKVKTFTITGNPMRCNCIESVTKWLERIEGVMVPLQGCTDSRLPYCVFPKILSLECEENIDNESVQRYMGIIKGNKELLACASDFFY
ncbi:PREDICTED: leucine-rich repeat-containing protein 15-like [Nicrophorus vespilloides]|uniref:Leucine-rich repeat-containing protein 15-like n=1 Tax=Nicrophorus vespilloides TaxID=110193 RepID=A0ABM1M2E5_NICVS|nr:PREDICTED: leucine-rich repeat-containing protein 15-like [Nicrophorus vespilloides]